MCLGIPMQIVTIEGYMALCEAKGQQREVGLIMLPEDSVSVGDYVVVHLGNAIETISEHDAKASWDLYDQMLADGHI